MTIGKFSLEVCKCKIDDPENQNMKATQVAQNKMMRMLDGVSLKEHVTSSSLLLKYNIPSVNKLA